MLKTDLQRVGEDSKHIWATFWSLVDPYRDQLWYYCLKLTGTPWDAEDLLQDTLLKSFAALSALSHREQPLQTKSYIFRVATNHWFDQCWKNRITLDETYIERQSEDQIDYLEVNEAIEALVHHLPPKQAVVFILIESFRFTAKEVAELIVTTEGAVNAILHRARKKLNDMNLLETNVKKQSSLSDHSPTTVKQFIDRYNRQDFKGLADLLINEATYSFVSMTSTEYGKETITKHSLNPKRANQNIGITAHAYEIWGMDAIVFIKNTENGKRLFDVNTIEWEDGKITRWKCYYFCREFMSFIANELNLPLEPIEMY
ncbi:sigma-70 family RNA polymerase sigma factor [Heyndrickxia sporothermodurans]